MARLNDPNHLNLWGPLLLTPFSFILEKKRERYFLGYMNNKLIDSFYGNEIRRGMVVELLKTINLVTQFEDLFVDRTKFQVTVDPIEGILRIF